MTSIAVIGSKGFVGGAVYEALLHSGEFSVTGVTRESYSEMQSNSYDVIINCAMPSGRFWAKNNPEADFTETVQKTAELIYRWNYKKFVQISTVSARCQLDTVYGRHKAAAEKLCDFGDNLVIRLGALYAKNMTKGVLLDMLQGKKVFVDGDSRYGFISTDFCATWLATHMDRKGILELGGKHALAIREVAKHMGVNIEFEGELNHQDTESPEEGFPEAREVLTFIDNFRK